jgi:hypothetical protein
MRRPSQRAATAALLLLAALAGRAQAEPRHAEPVGRTDAMEVCRIGQFTGFRPPGSDTCLRVGGFIRYSADLTETRTGGFVKAGAGYAGDVDAAGNPIPLPGRPVDRTQIGASATFRLDARTTTDYGLLRAYMELRAFKGTGANFFELEKGFVRFGDVVAGKFQSFYDFSANDYNTVGSLGSDASVIGLAFTRELAKDWFITVSAEDGRSRRQTVSPNYLAPYTTDPAGRLAGVAYSVGAVGDRWPDLVSALIYDPSPTVLWQLSGALHPSATAMGNRGSAAPDATRVGWAAQLGLRYEPAWLPKGDSLVLQAAYTDGALSYIGATASNSGYGNVLPIVGASDAILVGSSAKLRLARGWNVLGTAIHAWAPSFDTGVWASYTQVDYPGGPLFGTVSAAFPLGIAARDFRYVQVGAGARWRPVGALQISLMGNVYWIEAKQMPTDAVIVAGQTVLATPRSARGFQSSLRIQTSF